MTTTKVVCRYCGNAPSEARVCASPNGPFVCTRPPGHDGDHVACGDKHRVQVWNHAGVVKP